MSNLTVGTFSGLAAQNYQIKLSAGSQILNPNSVVNTVSTTKTDQWTTTSATPIDVTGMSASITPKSTASKILVIVNINISLSGAGGDAYVRLTRNGTPVGNGAAGYFAQVAGQDYYQADCKCVTYLDSPATIATTTYSVQGWRGANTLYVNGRGLDGAFITSSSITLLEIA